MPLPPPEVAASVAATAEELFGWAVASSAGALKSSSCVSLLELCPNPDPRSSTCTRSERGGARLGAFCSLGEVLLPEEVEEGGGGEVVEGDDGGGALVCR